MFCLRLVRIVLLWVSQQLVGVALARLPHIARRQAVAFQCHNGIARFESSGSPGVVEGILALGLAAVLLVWPALVRCSVPVVRSRGVSLLFFLPGPFHVHPGKRPPESPGSRSLQSSGSSPSQASQAGYVSLLKTRGPCNWAGVRVNKSQSFTFL